MGILKIGKLLNFTFKFELSEIRLGIIGKITKFYIRNLMKIRLGSNGHI